MSVKISLRLNLAKKLLLATASILIAVGLYEGTSRPATAAAAAPFGKALVLRDIPSWNRHPDFENVLGDLKLPFDVKPSADMSKVDLSRYDFVVIPGAQWNTGYYKAFGNNAAIFERYVSEGGMLVVEMNGAEREGIALPGGVSMVLHPAYDNLITLPDHPILTPLAGKPRITAHLASHGYLLGVPAGSLVLAAEMAAGQITADMSKPTFVEYAYGKGRVIAAAQCFHDQDTSGRGPLMATLLKYAAAKEWLSATMAPAGAVAAASQAQLKVDPSVFDRYVGHYQVTGNKIIAISRSGERLFGQIAGQPPVEIYAKSEREYFAKVADAQVTFVTDADGRASRLVLRQNGRELIAPRIDDALAKKIADALEKRIRDGIPASGSEAKLRQHIAELASGKPDYDGMVPELAVATRVQLVQIQRQLSSLGRVESVQLKRVDPDGSDVYDVKFEHGSLQWRIGLIEDGRIGLSFFRSAI